MTRQDNDQTRDLGNSPYYLNPLTMTITIIPAPEIWYLRGAKAFLFCNLSIKKNIFSKKWEKNHVIRPLSSSSLRSRLYWLPSIDISSSFSQVLPRFPAGRRWCLFYLFYLFTLSFYSFYPYLYINNLFFLSYRSQNIFPWDGFREPFKNYLADFVR